MSTPEQQRSLLPRGTGADTTGSNLITNSGKLKCEAMDEIEEEAEKAMKEAVSKSYLVIALTKKDALRIGFALLAALFMALELIVNHFMPEDEE